MKISLEIGLTPATLKVLRDVILKEDRIMATLAEIKAATEQNGAAARAAIDRVAADVQALQAKIQELIDQITNNPDAVELAELKAGLDEVAAGLNATTGLLTGLDPVP